MEMLRSGHPSGFRKMWGNLVTWTRFLSQTKNISSKPYVLKKLIN